MNKASNFIPASPVERDCIPKQVATEMLASPKAKLSNRMRKNCHAARATLWPVDKGPLHRVDSRYCYDYDPLDTQSAEEKSQKKLERKFYSLPIAKLVQINRRAFSRRLAVQSAFEKIVGDESNRAKLFRALLNSKADAFDMLFDVSEAEINRRMAIAVAKGREQEAE